MLVAAEYAGGDVEVIRYGMRSLGRVIGQREAAGVAPLGSRNA